MIHAKFDDPMNDYMVLMGTVRKAEDEHEQEKHSNSYTSKSCVVSDVPLGNEGNTNPESKASTQEPWQSWLRYNSH